jgi:hypothetical protein
MKPQDFHPSSGNNMWVTIIILSEIQKPRSYCPVQETDIADFILKQKETYHISLRKSALG